MVVMVSPLKNRKLKRTEREGFVSAPYRRTLSLQQIQELRVPGNLQELFLQMNFYDLLELKLQD